MNNTLYYGDNLDILRRYVSDESIDLIYLDPPFNSKQNFNILFKTPKGESAEAQVAAFKDTWSWSEQSEREFDDLKKSPYTHLTDIMRAFRSIMGASNALAYLTMMASRLVELHRVLKPTGSLYLHCDPTASHYLKILLDGVFLRENFVNEIVWQRTSAKSDYKQGATNLGRVHDVIFLYHKNAKGQPKFHQILLPHDKDYLRRHYRHQDPDGRVYRLDNLAAPGRGTRGHPEYEFMGVKRYWRYSQEKMEQLLAEGRIVQKKAGAVPCYKRYLDEVEGVAVHDVWTDIPPVQGQAREFLGYPTQKPLRLLERIIQLSSQEGDVVLDPFCGCGTTVHAAERLGRRWIGIDITHLAITLIEHRMKNAFPEGQFEVVGRPKDLASARDLSQRDKYQFQWWACSLVGAQPRQGQKKGADKGIDGLIYFTDIIDGQAQIQRIIVSVKGGDAVGVAMVRELRTVMEQQDAALGFFISLVPPTKPMYQEALEAGFYVAGNGQRYPRLQLFTVEELLEGQKKPDYVDFSFGEETFKKAQREKKGPRQDTLI